MTRVTIAKCPCGNPGCSDYHLVGIGKFCKGSGFSKEEAQEIADLLNAQQAQEEVVPVIDIETTKPEFEKRFPPLEGMDYGAGYCAMHRPMNEVEKAHFHIFSGAWVAWQEAYYIFSASVPNEMKEYSGYVPPEDGSAGDYYVQGWNDCRDAMLAALAPAEPDTGAD